MSTLHENDYCNKHEQWKNWIYHLLPPKFAPDFVGMESPLEESSVMEKIWDCCKCFKEKHQEA